MGDLRTPYSIGVVDNVKDFVFLCQNRKVIDPIWYTGSKTTCCRHHCQYVLGTYLFYLGLNGLQVSAEGVALGPQLNYNRSEVGSEDRL